MCGGPEQSNSASTQSASSTVTATDPKEMNEKSVGTEDSFYSLLELASDNDVEDFKLLMGCDYSLLNKTGLWYVRQRGSKQVVRDYRSPLMVAAMYGSVDVTKFILSHPEADVNLLCGPHKSSALHCAASGGSPNAVEVIELLLSAGADVNCVDANGDHPIDVISVHPKLQHMRARMEELLGSISPSGPVHLPNLRVSVNSSSSESPGISSLQGNGLPSPDSIYSPMAAKYIDGPVSSTVEKKEYPIDPSLPDIKNSVYATDEFRMFSFKIRPCSRAYSHDWTECPFVHPGENARRRDPRKFHYSCVPCPDFRKGACRRGDMCEYAHGVFECWLHPAQYRTRLCKDGTNCNRRVCFFAHAAEELRPLYLSTGSAVPSPRSTAPAATVMDMSAAMNLFPGSPSSVSALSASPFSQPMSPSSNGISHAAAWPQPNVPTLHLPGSNLQSSRLRSSLSARDVPPENLNLMLDFDSQQQLLNELNCYSQPRPSPVSAGRCGRSKALTPSNLEELFSAEFSSSPRFSDPAAASVFSPTHKSAVFHQFQQQQQSLLSQISIGISSPQSVDRPLLQGSFGASSPVMMSPRSMEPISPMGPRFSAFFHREKQRQLLHSLSSKELGSNTPTSVVGSPVNYWSQLGVPNGKMEWSVNGDEHSMLRRSNSFELANNGEEPDVSWVQSLVKEPSPPEMIKEKLAVPFTGPPAPVDGLTKINSKVESVDHSIVGAWLEQMQLDQLVV